MGLYLKTLMVLLALTAGVLLIADLGAKHHLTATQDELINAVEGTDAEEAVQNYVRKSRQQRGVVIQQLMVAGLFGMALFMVALHHLVLKRISAAKERVKAFQDGQPSLTSSEPGNDDIATLSHGIDTLIQHVQALEKEAAVSRARADLLVAGTTEFSCRLNQLGVFAYINGAFCQFCGMDQDTILGSDFADLLESGDRNAINQMFHGRQPDDTFTSETRLTNSDGETIFIRWSWHAMADADGKLEFQGIGQDITREQEMLQNLDRQRKVEQLLLAASTNLISLPTDKVDNGINDVLAGVGDFLGADNGYVYKIRKQELTATHLWRKDNDVIPTLQGYSISLNELPWASARFDTGDMMLVENADSLPEEASAETKFLDQVGLASLIVVPLHVDSRLAGLVFFDFANEEQVFDEDTRILLRITGELIANALERKEAMIALESGQQRLRTIFSNVQSGIFVTNLRTREIVDVNDRACDMVDIPRDSLLGSPCLRVFDSLPAMPGNPREGISWNIEDHLKDRHGKQLPILRTTVTIMIQGELHLVESVVDLSNQKKLETQRLQNERLQGVLEMAGAACHELNQPLQVICGYADLLMVKMPEDDPNYSRLKLLSEQVKRLGDITSKINNITTYETQDYLSGQIIDIDKSVSGDDETAGFPADRVNELLNVLKRQGNPKENE